VGGATTKKPLELNPGSGVGGCLGFGPCFWRGQRAGGVGSRGFGKMGGGADRKPMGVNGGGGGREVQSGALGFWVGGKPE
jgi:hypothetical protein